MSYQARHTFVDGAHLLGAQLANCSHCGTLRVIDTARHPEPRYVRPGVTDANRDTFECPPCVSLSAQDEAARARVRSMNEARRREQAVRVAVRDAPLVVPPPEPEPQRMLPNFPWYSDMPR